MESSAPIPPLASVPAPPRRGRIFGVAMALVVILGVALYFDALQFSTDALVDNDGYFHIKYSYLMSHGHGIIRKLPWLQYTIHRDHYRDHHFLFHVLQIPFTYMADLRLAGKVSAWLFSVVAGVTFYFVLARRGRVTAAILTVVLLGAGFFFLTRMCMARVPSLSLAALLLGIHLIIARRYRWLFAVMFAYVWLYDGFAQLLGAGVCFLLAGLLIERRMDWRLLLTLLGGTVAGIVVNPYFPSNVSSLWFNLVRTAGSAQVQARTGMEWLPVGNTWELLTACPGIWIALALALLLVALRGKPRRDTTALLLITLLATVLTMKARRYLDMWPALVLYFLAWAWADYWEDIRAQFPFRGRLVRAGATVALAGLMAFTPGAFRREAAVLRQDRPFDYYARAALWLRDNTPPGELVFNVDWDDFPHLFFFNSENHYILGLDKLYMMRYDQRLFERWEDISEGSVKNPSGPIYDEFGAQYIFADRATHLPFILQAERDPNIGAPVYTDRSCVVYRITPP